MAKVVRPYFALSAHRLSVLQWWVTMSFLQPLQLSPPSFSQFLGDNLLSRRPSRVFGLVDCLGVHLPMCVVFDLWVLFSVPQPVFKPLPPFPAAQAESVQRYRAFLAELVLNKCRVRLATVDKTEETVAALIAKWLGPLQQYMPSVACFARHKQDLSQLQPSAEREQELVAATFSLFVELNEMLGRLLLRLELIDIDVVHLVAKTPPRINRPELGPTQTDLLDLQRCFDSLDSGYTTSLLRDLLSNLSRPPSPDQSSRSLTGGYLGYDRVGSVQALLPSELAHEEEIFLQRYALSEQMYLQPDSQKRPRRDHHMILVDGSNSMRGLRQALARGLAWALSVQLARESIPTSVRFFDGILHPDVNATGSLARLAEYLLGFRCSRGRNYTRVFEQVHKELVVSNRNQYTKRIFWILTHSECHIPEQLVEQLRSYANLHAVFMMPGRPLHLEYLRGLTSHFVVEQDEVCDAQQRAEQVMKIIRKITDRNRFYRPSS